MEEELIKKFKKYVDNFDTTNENITRKYFHSIRVMNFATEIAKSLNLDEYYIELSMVAGILHDYGRFEQWKRYNTYSDVDSIDHGDLAVKLLFEKNQIINFYNNEDAYKQLYYAIKFHNKLKISKEVDEKYKLICNIIRDADKLDIFNLSIENKKLFSEDDCNITDKIKNNFFEGKCISYQDIKNKSDKIILLLATFYDINFDYSKKYIKENKIIERMFMNIENKSKYKQYFERISDI